MKDLRAAVQVVDDDVEAAVVVEVSGREAATDAFFHHRGPELRRDFVERAVAAIVIEQLALTVTRRRAEFHFVELRVNMAVHGDDVQQPVVVVVEECRTPADERQADSPRSSIETTGP